MFKNFFRDLFSPLRYEPSGPLNQTHKPFNKKELIEINNSLKVLLTDAEEIKSDIRFINFNLDKLFYQNKNLHI